MQIAAIDIGTNSIHMIIVRIGSDLSFEVIDREKDMVRLGASGLEGGALSPTAMAAGLQTLAKFRRLAESHGVDEIIAAATSAVRESENGGDFIAEVYRTTGIRVNVISGSEEARLIHLAAVYAAGIGARTGIVIDIGGGSVEITLGTSARMQIGRSFKLGVIRLTEKFVTTDPLSRRDERRMVKAIRKETRGFLTQLRKRGFDRVIGTSGTIQTIGQLAAGGAQAGDMRNLRVSARAIQRVRQELTEHSLDERLKMPGLDPRRADLSVAGAVLLDTILTDLRASHLSLCDFALREGLVLDYARRNRAQIQRVDRYPDVRRRSVISLAERCEYIAPHARQVARLCLQLFDQLKPEHGLGTQEREWLEYAALLHDIGVHISYERHHKHSYYLIKNGDLRGFEPSEIETIALVARYHRQNLPKKSHEGYQTLDRNRRRTVQLLGALLRLAEGLERSHAQVVTDVRVQRPAKGRGVPFRIRLRTAGDAELEVWAAHRHVAALASWLDRPILFEIKHAPTKGGASHAQHAPHTAYLPGQTVRRRGHRRLGKDHAARPPRQVAGRRRTPRLRH
jgi:exopolyphosphatase / guanosine-5'-triphosphate,3'-diphosphate pyrophosphatase